MVTTPRTAAIVLAAGAGHRMGSDRPKALVRIGGRPIVVVATGSAASAGIGIVVVAAPVGFEGAIRDAVGPAALVVQGGASRQQSVRAALAAVPADVEVIAVHDAARPFAAPALFDDVIACVRDGASGAVPGIPIADTVKRVEDGIVVATEARERLVLAQTPQAFRIGDLREAHARALEAGVEFTDDAALLEWAGFEVRVVAGDPDNFKITTLLDLARAEERMSGHD
jgi:2-C-methyl-D-erythritol 4-phosphate cytidylyltransferase